MVWAEMAAVVVSVYGLPNGKQKGPCLWHGPSREN